MNRLFCLVLVAIFASLVSPPPIDAQPKNAPPKNFTNSIGMKFVWIPPGNFVMGSPNEMERKPFVIEDPLAPELILKRIDETQHKATLTKGYYMSVTTVTQEQWQAVMGNNPSHFKGENNLPVDSVSWDDCQTFIKELKKKDKKPYRLPSEAEWEYACRAGTKTPFHFGEMITTNQANFRGFTKYFENGKDGVQRNKTTPVGSFQSNAWGLHDMHGNVWQWCQDWYGDYPRKELVEPEGPEKGKFHVLRGGAWDVTFCQCRSAARYYCEPQGQHSNIGFRLCFFVK